VTAAQDRTEPWTPDWDGISDLLWDCLERRLEWFEALDAIRAVVAEYERQRQAAGLVTVRREIVELFASYAMAQAVLEALLEDDERDPLRSNVGDEINAAVRGLHEITEQLEAISPELLALAATPPPAERETTEAS